MIQLKEVSFSYPKKKGFFQSFLFQHDKTVAVDKLTCTIEKGEFICFIGMNGAGKSTLLKIIASIIIPVSGKVLINGCDSSIVDVRQKIGVVLNNERSFYFRLTAYQNLEFFGALQNMSGKHLQNQIKRSLTLAGIAEHTHKRYDTLSHGMKQKLALVRALLHDPEIILLDEPTSGMDLISEEYTHKFLLKLKQKGKTIIIATHNLNEAVFADKSIILKNGKLVSIVNKGGDLEQKYRRVIHAR